MLRIAWQMLVADRAKFFGLLFGIRLHVIFSDIRCVVFLRLHDSGVFAN